VRRSGLAGVTPGAGEFRVDLPAGLPVTAEDSPRPGVPGRDAPEARNLLADAAGIIGRRVAHDAAGAARNILRRLEGR
jgi:hypothetical protein